MSTDKTTRSLSPDDPIHSVHNYLLKRVRTMRKYVSRIQNTHPDLVVAFDNYDHLLPDNIFDLNVAGLREAGLALAAKVNAACQRGGDTEMEPAIVAMLLTIVTAHAAYIEGPLL